MIALQLAIWPLKSIDRWLLIQRPLVWRARLHIVLWLAFVFNLAIVAAFSILPLALTNLFSQSVYQFYQFTLLLLGFLAVGAWSADQYLTKPPQSSLRGVALAALTNLLITTTLLFSLFVSFATVSTLRMAATATMEKVEADREVLRHSQEAQSDWLTDSEKDVARTYAMDAQSLSATQFRTLLEDRLSQVAKAHEVLGIRTFLSVERVRSLYNGTLLCLLIAMIQTAVFCRQSTLDSFLPRKYIPVRYDSVFFNRIAAKAWRPFRVIDKWLLANRPLTWAVQPHVILPLIVGINILFGLLELILQSSSQQTDSMLDTAIVPLNLAILVLWAFLNSRRNLKPRTVTQHLYVVGIFALAGAFMYSMAMAAWHAMHPGQNLNDSYGPFILVVALMIILNFIYLQNSIRSRTITFAMLLAGILFCCSLYVLPFIVLFSICTRFLGGFVAAFYFFCSIRHRPEISYRILGLDLGIIL